MTLQTGTPVAKEEQIEVRTPTTGDSSCVGGSLAGPVGIIPVGQEPPRQPMRGADDTPKEPASRSGRQGKTTGRRSDKDRNTQAPIRNPDGFYAYKNRLDELRVFRKETMRTLKRRAELAVWMAIFGCQHHGRTQISQARIAELAGIKGRRHVVDAIHALREKGLLEVLVQGRYRPNGAEEHGLASVYRVYPRPEPRLLNEQPGGGAQVADGVPGGDRVGEKRVPK